MKTRPTIAKKLRLPLFFMFCLPGLYAQTNCVLKKEQDNIKVYACATEGSAYKTVKAEFEINCTVDEYISNAVDVDHYKEWHFREVNPTLLKRISDTELYYYTEVSAPFPVSNRDLILHLTITRNTQDRTSIRIQNEPNYLPEKNGLVRVRKSVSEIILVPISKDRLKVTYQIQIDPGGSIPAWLVNQFSTQAPYETFKNLIKRLENKPISASRN